MQNLVKFERPKPRLKHSAQAQLSALPSPQPPTQHRNPPTQIWGKLPRKISELRGGLPLHLAIDYDKLTPNQQARWDEGMYGSIQLKEDRGRQYYVVRWVDPNTGVRRSNNLGDNFEDAKRNLKLLIHPPT